MRRVCTPILATGRPFPVVRQIRTRLSGVCRVRRLQPLRVHTSENKARKADSWALLEHIRSGVERVVQNCTTLLLCWFTADGRRRETADSHTDSGCDR